MSRSQIWDGSAWVSMTGDGTDSDAIHDNVDGEISSIAAKGSPDDADFLLIEDAAASNAKKRITIGDLPGGGGASSQLIVFATGDVEAEVKTGTARLKMPFAATVISVTPTAGVAPTGADLIADMHLNGTTIFTTQGNRPTIADGDQDGSKTTPDVTAIASGDVLTMDIDQIGSTLPGENVVIILEITVP